MLLCLFTNILHWQTDGNLHKLSRRNIVSESLFKYFCFVTRLDLNRNNKKIILEVFTANHGFEFQIRSNLSDLFWLRISIQ